MFKTIFDQGYLIYIYIYMYTYIYIYMFVFFCSQIETTTYANKTFNIPSGCESSRKGQIKRKTNASKAILSIERFFQDENTNDV